MANLLNKLFVKVPAGSEASALAASAQTANSKKIYFFADGRIVADGKAYSVPTADIDAIKSVISGLGGTDEPATVVAAIAAAKTALEAADTAIDNRVKAIEALIGGEEADTDDVINKVKEVIEWFNEVKEGEGGKVLVADVAANKAAIGAPAKDGEGATGLYKVIEDASAASATAITDAINALDVDDAAVAGKYVASVKEVDGKIEVTRANLPTLPTLSVKTGSENYVAVNDHEIEVKTSALGSVDLSFNETTGKWVAGTRDTAATGLAMAADVATELANDEVVIAGALNKHEEAIAATNTEITALKNAKHDTVTASDTDYLTVAKDADQIVTITEKVVKLADASETKTGIADAKDVKDAIAAAQTAAQTYVDTYDFWETYTA